MKVLQVQHDVLVEDIRRQRLSAALQGMPDALRDVEASEGVPSASVGSWEDGHQVEGDGPDSRPDPKAVLDALGEPQGIALPVVKAQPKGPVDASTAEALVKLKVRATPPPPRGFSFCSALLVRSTMWRCSKGDKKACVGDIYIYRERELRERENHRPNLFCTCPSQLE